MNKSFLKCILFFAILIFSFNLATSQVRIAVLPFQNMDGEMRLNIWCYKLQDSVTNALKEKDPTSKYFYIVPADSVEELVTGLNIDPTNPQYPSDVWKVIKAMNVQYVVMGNFNKQVKKILINAYIYNVRTKLPNNKYQARDIFLEEPTILESVPVIIKEIIPALIPDK